MKFTKVDLLILIIPVFLIILATPFLPDQIPMQWNSKGQVNWYLPKKLGFLIGLLPFVIYEGQKLKNSWRQ